MHYYIIVRSIYTIASKDFKLLSDVMNNMQLVEKI